MMIKLLFDEIPLSGNLYSKYSATRRNYKPRVRGLTLDEYKTKWGVLTKRAWLIAGNPEYKNPVIIKPELHRWNMKAWYDTDNLWQGLKPIIDFLVKFGMFTDDTQDLIKHGIPEWIKDREEKMILKIDVFKIVDVFKIIKFNFRM